MPPRRYIPAALTERQYVHPQVRFVAMRRITCKLAPTSEGTVKAWTIEGYGPTPAEAFAHLVDNIREFTGTDAKLRVGRLEIREVLGGNRLTAAAIAALLGCSTRQVHLAICNGYAWLERERGPDGVNVYSLEK